MICLMCRTAFAAVTFNVQVPSTSVKPGDLITITVSLDTGGTLLSEYSYNINYDPELLEYVSGGELSYDGCVSYSGTGSSGEQVFTFTALTEGTASIETIATDIICTDGSSESATPAYNSISISENADTSEDTDTSAETDTTGAGDVSYPGTDDSYTVMPVDDEVGTLTEADQSAPDGTIVSVHAGGGVYNILEKPDSVDAPSLYMPVTINLNDVDVSAYIRRSSDSTVLLYASGPDGYVGWYFFDTDEGTFLAADDILGDGSGSVSSFVESHKFIIMLIAIIILVILIIVIIILAVSLKGIMKDYETEIERLKKEGRSSEEKGSTKAGDKSDNVVHTIHRAPEGTPMLGDKALFPSDDEVHESYADSDYDNQVQLEGDDDKYDGDDYDDSAFSESSDMKASFDKIDEVLESTKKYKK